MYRGGYFAAEAALVRLGEGGEGGEGRPLHERERVRVRDAVR